MSVSDINKNKSNTSNEEVRTDILDISLSEGLSTSDLRINMTNNKIAYCVETADVVPLVSVEGGKLKSSMKRVFRKLSSIYVIPSFKKQSSWNLNSAAAMSMLSENMRNQHYYINELEDRIAFLEREIRSLRDNGNQRGC